MQGKIIEYVEQGKFICAMVMSDSGKRLHLLNQNGREVNLPQARVVHQSKGTFSVNGAKDLILTNLKDVSAGRESLTLPVTLEDVWLLASDEDSQEFSPVFLTELCYGEEADDNQVAAFLRAVFADSIYFKYRNGKILVHSQETVEQLLARREQEYKKEQMLTEGARSLKLISEGTPPGAWPQAHCLSLLRDYYLFDKEAEDWELARDLLKKAELTRPHDAFHLLVKMGYWPEDENIPLLRYRVPTEFSPESMAQVATICEAAKDIDQENRCDFRHLPVLTIDGASTRDFDDALHIDKKGDNFEVGIHITDVSQYIPPGSPLFKVAEERATSIYFPDATVPMLPRDLSEGAFSLIQGQDRAAISFLVTLSPTGEVVDSKIVRSIIRIKRQLSYRQAEGLLKDDLELQALEFLSQKLRHNRIEAGALIIPIPDVGFHIEDGAVTSINLFSVESTMRVLVSEFMVLANTIGAAFLANRQEPGLYRSQEPARKRFYKQPDQDLFINFRQRRFLSRGYLLTTPKRHDGVGVEQYTTVTSPIRRLLDLVIQHQISSILAYEGAKFSVSEMNGFAALIQTAQSRVNLVRQQRHRYWLFKYLQTKKGEKMSAFVLDRRNRKIQLVLKDYLFEVELPGNQGKSLDLGDSVMIKLSQVNVMDNTIKFEW